MRSRPCLLAALLAATLLLAGCGSVRIAYNQLDWLVPWSLRDYVQLSDEQRGLFEARLEQRIVWHCTSELPAYAEFLRGVDQDLAAERVEVATLERHADRIEAFVRTVGEAVAQDVADILAALDEAQIDRLAARFERSNREAREKYVDAPADELHAGRVERMEKRLRRWFGRLNTEQRDLVDAWSRNLEPAAEEWLARRVAWQDDLLDALRKRDERPDFDARIRHLLLDAGIAPDSAQQARIERNRQRSFELIAAVHAEATAAQRERLSREIQSLVRQFDVLACADPAIARLSALAPVPPRAPIPDPRKESPAAGAVPAA